MDLFSDKNLPWLILKEIPDLGNRTCKRLIDRFLSPEKVLTAPEDELKKLFKPFYTTKKKGTGLGYFQNSCHYN